MGPSGPNDTPEPEAGRTGNELAEDLGAVPDAPDVADHFLRNLSDKEQRLVVGMLEGKTIAGAAQAAGVPYTTAKRWLGRVPLKRALEAGHATFAAVREEQLRRGVHLAFQHLNEILEAPEPGDDASVEVRATWLERRDAAARAYLGRVKPFALSELHGTAGSSATSDEDWDKRYVTPEKAFIPHRMQREAIQCTARFVAIVAGIQGGKTAAAAILFWKRIREWVATHATGERGRFWLVAPNSIIGKVMCERFESLAPPNWIIESKGGDGNRTWTLRDGSMVEFRSAEHADKLVARTLHGFWLDEFTLCKPDIWLTSLRQRIAATNGWAIFSGTPRGRNWAWEHVWTRTIKGHDNYDPSFAGFTWPSSENPAIPKEEIEAARRQLPSAYFKREWEASWEAFHGQVFSGWGDHLIVPAMNPPLPTGTIHVMGIDWGFAAQGAIVVARRLPGGIYEIVDEVVEAGRLPDWWQDRIIEKWQRWKCARIWADPAGADRIATIQQEEGLPIHAADNTIDRGIREIAALVSQRALRVSPRCPILAGQMASYRWQTTATGERREIPVKENDHAVDALRYAVYSENSHALTPAVRLSYRGNPLPERGGVRPSR